MCVLLVAQSCLTLCSSMDCNLLGPLSMEFSRQECWSGLPFASPGDLPDPGIKPTSFTSPASAGGFFTVWAISDHLFCLILELHAIVSYQKRPSFQWVLQKEAQVPHLYEGLYSSAHFSQSQVISHYSHSLWVLSLSEIIFCVNIILCPLDTSTNIIRVI